MSGLGSQICGAHLQPDLSSCDFFMFGPLKSAAYRRRRQTLDELRNFITTEWEVISQRSINAHAAIDCFLSRVQAVVDNGGEHIEHLNF